MNTEIRFESDLIDESLPFETWSTEVQQQGSLVAGGLEIVEDLGFFDAAHFIKRFDFYDDVAEADEICAIQARKLAVTIMNLTSYLSLSKGIPRTSNSIASASGKPLPRIHDQGVGGLPSPHR